MNYKTLALASLFMLAAGTIANADEQITGERIQDVGFNKAEGRYYGTKQGPFYQYEDPNNPGHFYATKYWENEPAAECGDCGRCNLCAPACPTCR